MFVEEEADPGEAESEGVLGKRTRVRLRVRVCLGKRTRVRLRVRALSSGQLPKTARSPLTADLLMFTDSSLGQRRNTRTSPVTAALNTCRGAKTIRCGCWIKARVVCVCVRGGACCGYNLPEKIAKCECSRADASSAKARTAAALSVLLRWAGRARGLGNLDAAEVGAALEDGQVARDGQPPAPSAQGQVPEARAAGEDFQVANHLSRVRVVVAPMHTNARNRDKDVRPRSLCLGRSRDLLER